MSEQESAVSAKLIGRKTTPRALIVTDEDNFAEQLKELFPTSYRGKGAVREAEYDVIVATKAFILGGTANTIYSEPSEHLSVIAFGVASLGAHATGRTTRGGDRLSVTLKTNSVAREYLPHDVPEEFRTLVETDLLPVVRQRQGQHPVLQLNAANPDSSTFTPLLSTAEGKPLAGLFRRRGKGAGLVLALPGDVQDRLGWVRAALKYFRARWPALRSHPRLGRTRRMVDGVRKTAPHGATCRGGRARAPHR